MSLTRSQRAAEEAKRTHVYREMPAGVGGNSSYRDVPVLDPDSWCPDMHGCIMVGIVRWSDTYCKVSAIGMDDDCMALYLSGPAVPAHVERWQRWINNVGVVSADMLRGLGLERD